MDWWIAGGLLPDGRIGMKAKGDTFISSERKDQDLAWINARKGKQGEMEGQGKRIQEKNDGRKKVEHGLER